MILRHRSPNGTVSEKHLKPHPTPSTDTLPHVYTLIIKPDAMMQVRACCVGRLAAPFLAFPPPPSPSTSYRDGDG